MTISKIGTLLYYELNEALGDSATIDRNRLDDVCLLHKRIKRYATRQEQACTYEWAWGDKWDKQDARLEKSIFDLAVSLPGITGVTFQGDPRGYVVKLQLVNGASNTWGKDGWGVA